MAAHYAAFAATVRWVFPASRILYRWYQHPEVFTNRNTPAILGWGQRRIHPDRSSRWQWIQSCSSHLRLPKPATKETKLFSVKQSCRKSRFGWWVTSNTLQTDCILTWRCIKTLVPWFSSQNSWYVHGHLLPNSTQIRHLRTSTAEPGYTNRRWWPRHCSHNGRQGTMPAAGKQPWQGWQGWRSWVEKWYIGCIMKQTSNVITWIYTDIHINNEAFQAWSANGGILK